MQDYPIFLTGNPPDLVRLAVEFGHVPFVDHLLFRGFRPRDLPEYFSLIPFLTPPPTEDVLSEAPLSAGVDNETIKTRRDIAAGIGEDGATSAEQQRATSSGRRESSDDQQRARDTALFRRSLELNQIWECMRLASQELMDACSRADFDAVLKVLDSTLVKPRLSLEESAAIEAASLAAATAVVRDAGDNEIEYLTISTGGGGGDRHGKRRQSSLDPIQSRHDSIGTGSEARFLDDDLTMTTTTTQQEVSGAGVGAYSSHRASAASAASRDRTLESSEEGE
jgi:hypothetical protein